MFFNKKEKSLLAVADGRAIPLSEVPDEAFASGILGVGVAIEPSGGTVCSPIDGVIESITETGHAYTVHSDDGLDILVHIGIDTVTLGGKGFLPMVKEGYKVKAGDVIARADLEAIRAAGLSTATVVLITNPERLEKNEPQLGEVQSGKSEIIRYRLLK